MSTAYVLEWGRWGPPMSGTYHLIPNCVVLRRRDLEREVVEHPDPAEALEDDDDWEACGHCGDGGFRAEPEQTSTHYESLKRAAEEGR